MVKKLDVNKDNYSCFVRVPMVCACDDSALYQTVLTGMLLYDAMHYACFGTSSYSENKRGLAWSKKDFKELTHQGAKLYSEASEDLLRDDFALFVTLIPECSVFSWTYIPRHTYLPIIENVLPMVIAYPFYELRLTKDICPMLRGIDLESFTEGIRYDRTRTTLLNCLEGNLYVKPEYASFKLTPPGSCLDAETNSKIWITKKVLHGSEELDNEGKDNTKTLTFYPESISDIRDIAFAVYCKNSMIVQSDLCIRQ